ncbi:MAG: PAS domain S-box protein, partial [Woeseia sp.]
LFASVFWLLDSGVAFWFSNKDLVSALLPEGGAFVSRFAYAALFATAGSIAGAALLRRREVEKFAVNKLQGSRSKYNALLAASFDSVIMLGRHARIMDISESAEGLLEASSMLMSGRPFDEFVSADETDGEVLIYDLLKRASSNQDEGVPVRIRSHKGRTFPAEIRVTPMPPGSDSEYVIAIRETTSSIVATKSMRYSERHVQSLFENILDGVYRSTVDGRILAANPALVRMLGYDSIEELIECSNTKDFFVDKEQRNRLKAELDANNTARNVEVTLRRRDGNTLSVLANVRAVLGDNNEDVIYEGTFTDISNLLQAREELKDSEAHFRSLCEHALDVVTVIDAGGGVVYTNPASAVLTGVPVSSQIGMKMITIVHRDDVETVNRMVRAGFERPGSPHRFTCRIFRQDGVERLVEAVGTAYLSRQGELRAIIHSRDITERVESETALRDMQKLQVVSQLTDGLTHEFSNLLTVISGNLDMLDDSIADPTRKIHVRSAMNACQQGTDMLRRMMAFADRSEALPEHINVNGLLMDVEPVLRRSLSESIDVCTEYADELWIVNVDPVQLEAAILHLAVNAKEAMNGQGQLTIATRNEQISLAGEKSAGSPVTDCICISVTDNGSGMDDDVLEHATDSFYSASFGEGKHGLGLSVVRKVVETYGGKLTISSQTSHGTTVNMFLPRVNDLVAAAIKTTKPTSGAESILVVDDNPDVRNVSSALLRSFGYKVREAANGQAAMHLLQTEHVDLLFTDLAMPRLSGQDLAELARKQNPNLKVLLTSGNEAAMAEANDGLTSTYELIRKPFRKQRLAEHVREILDT